MFCSFNFVLIIPMISNICLFALCGCLKDVLERLCHWVVYCVNVFCFFFEEFFEFIYLNYPDHQVVHISLSISFFFLRCYCYSCCCCCCCNCCCCCRCFCCCCCCFLLSKRPPWVNFHE